MILSSIKSLLIELICNFILITIVLLTLYNNTLGPMSFLVAFSIVSLFYFGRNLFRAHINPMITISLYLKKIISADILCSYISFQILGACLAVLFNIYLQPMIL